ncbi:hypothetical protein [Pseudomonas putida]|uniref:hypothetical protein n=1 Tax=Pseudomonas putida TaxID=303 RepID=UPI002658F60C|nr:hypothetical protein [Pseudomonas putida]MCZ9636395.1 hypothetical protein [Pseudomonas putida]
MTRLRKPVRSPHPVRPFCEAAAQQPVAPIDFSYGQKGHGHFTDNREGNRGSATSVLKSKVRPGRFYVTGYQADSDGQHQVFIACLDENGKPDTTFNGSGMVDFTKLSTGNYLNADAVAEDESGNLLVSVSVIQESTTHLWKLGAKGEVDPNFGQGRGYVDTHDLFGVDLVLEKLACHREGAVATALRREEGVFKAVVVALKADGGRDSGFGEEGWLAMSNLIPESPVHILDGIAVIASKTGVQRIVISTYVNLNGDDHAVTSSLSLRGSLDETFGDKGHHWSEVGIINNGFTVEDSSERITLYGQHYSIDDDNSPPTLYRLDYQGKPAPEFNNGQVVRFDIDGAWDHIAEADGSLIGYGSFYDFAMAVRYTSSGQLDTRFVPPHGYGQFGAIVPQHGFYSYTYSMIIDTEKQRMLVSGEDVQQSYRLPCLIAVSLKQAR